MKKQNDMSNIFIREAVGWAVPALSKSNGPTRNINVFTLQGNILLLFILLFSIGCTQPITQTKQSDSQSPSPAIAMLNGKPITYQQFIDKLIPAYGPKILDELMLTEIVRQAAAEKGITLSSHQVTEQFNKFLISLAPDKTHREQNALYQYMLKSRNLSSQEFLLIIEREALLDQMIDPNVPITDDMLQQEYQRQHGNKRVVRSLVVSSFRDILTLKDKIEAGDSFKALVEQHSEDQAALSRAGLVGPFTNADDNIPEPVRTNAFALKQIGDFSEPFSYYDDANRQWWCVVQLENKFSDDAIPFNQAKPELIKIITHRVKTTRKMELLDALRKKAVIRILDDRLK